MFYGTITDDGRLDTQASFTNNFSASRSGTGVYRIIFEQWVGTKPTLLITPNTSSPSASHSAAYTIDLLDDGRYQATVYIYHDDERESRGFGFTACLGHALTFDATAQPNDSLVLEPSVIAFGPDEVPTLVLTSSISLGPRLGTMCVTLDKGTQLYGVAEDGGTMTLCLSSSSVTLGKTTWDLVGWVFGAGCGQTGTQWLDGQLTLCISDDPDRGPETTVESFVVVGTPRTGEGPRISSDPLVRLSSIPPAGIKG